MEVFEAIKKRRSVRAYQRKEIPEDILMKILESARLAPSAHNAQSWKFIVVRDEKTKEKLAQACHHQNFIKECDVVIAGVSLNPQYKLSSGIVADHLNLAVALDHMSLTATEEGIGSCWIGAFSQKEVKEILNIPFQYEVVALLTLGYPKEKDNFPKMRKELKEIISYEKFE